MLEPLIVWITTNCGKILQELGIPDHLTCPLRNLYADQKAKVRIRHGIPTGSKLGKECIKAVYRHLIYLTYMQSTSCETLGWMKHKVESRLQGETSITSDIQMTPPFGRKWRGTKEPLDEGERREWKNWLKTQHSKNKDHGIWSHLFKVNRWGTMKSDRLYFGGAPKSLQMVTATMKLKEAHSLEEKLWQT